MAPATTDDPIALSGVRKAFGSHVALDGVDLAVPRGSITGFLGPNGAGKTTTLRILVGLLRADAGSVRVLGVDPWGDVAARGALGFLPTEPGFHARLTGRQALDHLAALSRRPPVLRADACAAVALSAADLARPVKDYSRGMKQKVGIVQALQHDPALVVLDEPTEGLDPLVQRGLLGLLRDLAAAGRTVLLSSHTLPEVEELCDRVAIIRDGRVVRAGTLDELRRARPRRVALRLADPAGPVPDACGEVVERDGARVVLRHAGPVAPLLAALAALAPLDVEIVEAGLDDVFLAHYGAGGSDG